IRAANKTDRKYQIAGAECGNYQFDTNQQKQRKDRLWQNIRVSKTCRSGRKLRGFTTLYSICWKNPASRLRQVFATSSTEPHYQCRTTSRKASSVRPPVNCFRSLRLRVGP